MKDRVPGAPGQYKAIVTEADLQKMQVGEEFTITMTRDDKPIEEGTPYSKAAVLPDTLAASICPDVENPTPADALAALHAKVAGFSEAIPVAYYSSLSEMTAALDEELLKLASRTIKNLCISCSDAFAESAVNSCELFKYHNENARLIGCSYFGGQWQILKHDGVWGKVEWFNPPMIAGIEYCTVERFARTPVYKKALDLGQITAGGSIEVSHKIEGIKYPLDATFTISSGASAGEAIFTQEKLKITVPGDVSAGRVYAILSYTREGGN